MLVLSRADVEELLDVDRLIDALGQAMADVSAGRASMPARVAAMVSEREGLLGAMPAYLPAAGVLEAKLVSVFPRNAGTLVPTHQAVVVAFDPATGTPTALMDATWITELRTAAGSALATKLLSRPDSRVLAIIGTGAQARSHAVAMTRVRDFREIRVGSRDAAKAAALAAELSEVLGLPAVGADSHRGAMEGADVVCATTHPADPVVRRDCLDAGVHVNSVGWSLDGREVDAETVRDAVVVVESRAAALAPPPAGANDLTWAIRDGVIGEDHVHAEIGEVVSGARPGRTSPDQITLYKSVGVAAQDAAAAALVLEEAARRGAGVVVDL